MAHIRRSLTVTKGQVAVNKPKIESGVRFVGIDAATIALLRDLRRSQARQALEMKAGTRFNLEGFAFVRPDGGHIPPGLDHAGDGAHRDGDGPA